MSQAVQVYEARHPGVRVALAELWAHRELVVELCKRSLQLRYKNSILGVIWSLATPLMMTFVITIMMKVFVRLPTDNMSAYVLTGMFAWTFFAMAIPDCCTTLLEHAPMVRKVYFPRELLPITVVLSNFIHLLIALVVLLAYLVMLKIFPYQRNWEILLLLLVLPAQAMITLGLGLVVSSLNVLFEDIKYIVTVLMQVMFYAVPVIYPIELVARAAASGDSLPFLPDALRPYLLDLYLLNPFAAIPVLYQTALLPPRQLADTDPMLWSWGLLAGTWLSGLILMAIGVAVFNRLKWEVVERL